MRPSEVSKSMLAQIRAFAKSPFANVLLAIVLVSFVVFGIKGVGTSVGVQDEVIKAGSRPAVTSAAFKDRFLFFKQQLEQQNQQQISVPDAIKHDLDRRIADELAISEAFAEMLKRLGLRPSDQLIVDKLRTIPRFFNQITGQFDKKAYGQFLQQNNMTATQAEGELRDEIGERQFVSGMAAGLRSPLIYGAVQAAYLTEARDFESFVVSPAILGPPIKPTDDQLNKFIKENGAQLMKPEMRQFSVLHVSAAVLASTVAAADADVQKRFNFEKDTLSSPEKRSFQEVPLHDAAAAAGVIARLKAGADPNAVAKSVGTQLLAFTDQPRSAIPDKGVATAAFAMKPGEVKGPVQGDLGPSVIRMLTVTPGHEATLDEVRPKIEAEVKKAAAGDKAYQMIQKYEDLHSGGSDMAAGAKTLGQAVLALPPVTAKGVDIKGQPLNLPPKVLDAAFGQAQGGETDPIDAGQSDYYIVHVDKVLPPALPTLDEIRPKLTQYFILKDAAAKLQAKADALSAAIGKGQSMADAAKSVGVAVEPAKGVLRNAGGKTYSADLVGRLFLAKPGAVVVGEDTKLGFVIAKLERIVPASPAALAPLMTAQRDQVSKNLFDDLGQETRAAARALVKPHVDYARARQALGVDAGSGPDTK